MGLLGKLAALDTRSDEQKEVDRAKEKTDTSGMTPANSLTEHERWLLGNRTGFDKNKAYNPNEEED